MRVAYPTKESWLADRPTRIGASEVAAAVGCCIYTSPFELAARKIHRLPTLEVEDNENMEWGREFERPVARKAAARLGMEFIDEGEWVVYVHDDLPFLAATPDGLLRSPDRDDLGTIEVKTTGVDIDKPGVLLRWEIQLQMTLWCAGLTWGVLAILLFDRRRRLEVFRYERDDDLCLRLSDQCLSFWESVRAGELPDVDASESCRAALLALYEEAEDATIHLPARCIDYVDRRKWLEGEIGTLSLERDRIDNGLRRLLGHATVGELPDGRKVTNKPWGKTRRLRYP